MEQQNGWCVEERERHGIGDREQAWERARQRKGTCVGDCIRDRYRLCVCQRERAIVLERGLERDGWTFGLTTSVSLIVR